MDSAPHKTERAPALRRIHFTRKAFQFMCIMILQLKLLSLILLICVDCDLKKYYKVKCKNNLEAEADKIL